MTNGTVVPSRTYASNGGILCAVSQIGVSNCGVHSATPQKGTPLGHGVPLAQSQTWVPNSPVPWAPPRTSNATSAIAINPPVAHTHSRDILSPSVRFTMYFMLRTLFFIMITYEFLLWTESCAMMLT